MTSMTRGREQLVAPTMFKFSQQGKSGVFMSELLLIYQRSRMIMAVHSFNTNAINHDPGKTFFCTDRKFWKAEHGFMVELWSWNFE